MLVVIVAMIVRMRMVIVRMVAVIVLVMIMSMVVTMSVLMAARPTVRVVVSAPVSAMLMLVMSMLAVDMAAMRMIAMLVAVACAGMRLVRSIAPTSMPMLCRLSVVMVVPTLVLVFALPLRVRANSVRSMLVLFRLSLVMCAARCGLRLITVLVERFNRRMRMHVGMGLRRMPRASTAMRWLLPVGRGRWVVCGRLAHGFSFAKRIKNQLICYIENPEATSESSLFRTNPAKK